MKAMVFVVAFALLLLAGSLHAQVVLPAQGICSDLFGQVGANGQVTPGSIQSALPKLTDFTGYNFMLLFSLEIVLAVLMVLAIMYAIATAFGIQRVITFVRTEYLESVLNIVIIVLLFGGIGVLAGGIGFISNLGASVVSSSGVQQVGSYTLSLASSSSIGTITQVYNSICNTYFNDAVLHFAGLGALSNENLIYSIASGLEIQAMPNGMGIKFSPFFGITPFVQVLSFMTPLITGAIIVELGIIFLLGLIYYLFPIFLYLGILLRCLPWTRAAGGTLLALFIGFYVFFPALLYPFASIDYRCLAGQSSSCTLQPQQTINLPPVPSTAQCPSLAQSIACAFSVALNVPALRTFFFEGQFIALLDFWIFSIINASFQIFGVVISFVVSYSLLEGFADLLGAPSLTAKNLLRNVI
ncbi:MAG: hypothetical protein KGH53_00140 [Candidatus Micrarchaeota archaeon]|nr:hypothetical protein [Candidatus Micrarchaeota archaeon]